jgi:hypothetical protein
MVFTFHAKKPFFVREEEYASAGKDQQDKAGVELAGLGLQVAEMRVG